MQWLRFREAKNLPTVTQQKLHDLSVVFLLILLANGKTNKRFPQTHLLWSLCKTQRDKTSHYLFVNWPTPIWEQRMQINNYNPISQTTFNMYSFVYNDVILRRQGTDGWIQSLRSTDDQAFLGLTFNYMLNGLSSAILSS